MACKLRENLAETQSFASIFCGTETMEPLPLDRPTKRRVARGSKDRAIKSTEEGWQKGDVLFDHPEYRRKRLQLREDPDVCAALDEWWDATDSNKNGVIDRDEYICLGKALYRVMIGDGDERAAQKSAENDWKEDSKGLEVMKAPSFKRAVFELADLCACTCARTRVPDFLSRRALASAPLPSPLRCPGRVLSSTGTDTVDPKEYVNFLRDLLSKMKACGLGTDTIFAEAISRRSSLVPLPTSEMSPGDAAQGVLLKSALASQENVFGEFRERANKSPTFNENVMGSSEDEVAPTPAKARRGRRSSHEGAKAKAANPKEISGSVSAPAMRNSARDSRRSREVVVSRPRAGSAADNAMEASVTTQTAAEPASSVESLERPPPVRPRPSWLEKPAMAVGAAPLQNDVFDSEPTETNDTPCSIRAALSTMMPEPYHEGERVRVSRSPSCSDESVKEPPSLVTSVNGDHQEKELQQPVPKGHHQARKALEAAKAQSAPPTLKAETARSALPMVAAGWEAREPTSTVARSARSSKNALGLAASESVAYDAPLLQSELAAGSTSAPGSFVKRTHRRSSETMAIRRSSETMAIRRSSETMAISSAIGDMQVAEESFKDVNFQSAPPASFPESAPASFRQRKADRRASKETIQEGFIGLGGTNNGGIVVQESNLPSGGFSRPPQDEYKRSYYGKLPVTGRGQVGKGEGQSPRKIRQDPCWATRQAEAGGSASRDAFMAAPPPMEHVALHGLFLPLMGPGGKREPPELVYAVQGERETGTLTNGTKKNGTMKNGTPAPARRGSKIA